MSRDDASRLPAADRTSDAPRADPASQLAGGTARPGRARRVVLVISHLGDGGAERVVCALARCWADAGHAVGLVTIGGQARDVYPVPSRVHRIALDLIRPSRNAAEGVLLTARRVLALRRAILGERPDAVISFLDRTNVLCLLATSGTGVPVYACERTDPRHGSIGRGWGGLRRLLYPRAAGVVVQTERVAAWARRFCPRVHVIPNFVERPRCAAAPSVDRGPRNVLAMGRLAPEKGFDLLIEAFARAAAGRPEWSLTILGEGRERSRLEALVAVRGLAGRVTLPGRVADPVPQLAAAHAFVLPSRREGFPNALLEAMACGLPVVAFDCPSGPAEIITHERDGLLVKAEDVAELSQTLARVMGDPVERARLGRNATEVATRLAPGPILARWTALLEDAEPRR